jgi:hypothetical protein
MVHVPVNCTNVYDTSLEPYEPQPASVAHRPPEGTMVMITRIMVLITIPSVVVRTITITRVEARTLGNSRDNSRAGPWAAGYVGDQGVADVVGGRRGYGSGM